MNNIINIIFFIYECSYKNKYSNLTLNITQIVKNLNITYSNVTQKIKKLYHMGYIKIIVKGRIKEITISNKGIKFCEKIKPIFNEIKNLEKAEE